MRTNLHILSFVSIFALIYLSIHYYLAFWLLRHFQQLRPFQLTVRIALLAIALAMPLSMYMLRAAPNAATETLAYLTYTWMGVSFIWLSCALLSDGAALAAGLFLPNFQMPGAPALILLAAALITAFWTAARAPVLKKMEIRIAGLPQRLDGLTLAQISDMHLGTTTPENRFLRVVEMLKTTNPDIIMFTGDFIDNGFEDKDAAGWCAELKPRFGKFGVLGNHEFYYGLDKAVNFYDKCGIKLLRQEAVALENGVQIAGIDDAKTAGISQARLEALLSRLDRTEPAVLLSHEPVYFEQAAGYAGLTLSGHTHAGQIFPFNFLVKLRYPHIYGLSRYGAAFAYVTSGAGYWGPPMRLFTKNEIPVFTLRAK